MPRTAYHVYRKHPPARHLQAIVSHHRVSDSKMSPLIWVPHWIPAFDALGSAGAPLAALDSLHRPDLPDQGGADCNVPQLHAGYQAGAVISELPVTPIVQYGATPRT